MVGWLAKHRPGPIGVDIGSRSVKLLQFSADGTKVRETARWDLSVDRSLPPEQRDAQVVKAIQRAREGRNFRGRDAVFSINSDNLIVQNIRVARAEGSELQRLVSTEAATRIPFPYEEAEVRFLEAGDVRQGDVVRREVILLACHRPVLQRILGIAEETGLRAAAIDVEPNALLRCYAKQLRRDEDQERRVIYVHVGASVTTALIARGPDAVFVKYLDVGGRHLDEAVARHLQMTLADASALRRHNGDRRAEQRDPEVARSIAESIRPVLEDLVAGLSMCIRYYSVTFRGQPLAQLILGGGEASETLKQWLATRLDVPCQLGDPLRSYEKPASAGRATQWDVAAGLALRSLD
jgi:type IV pilus assembly protein PilM